MGGAEPPKKSWFTRVFVGLGALLWAISFVTNYVPEGLVAEGIEDTEIVQTLRSLGFICFAAGAFIAVQHLSAQLDYFSSRLNSDVQMGQKTYNLLQRAGVTSKEQVELLKPQELAQFEKVFSGAKTVRAYNPPLTVLIRQPAHRDVIFNVLNDSGSVYRMIAGRSLLARLQQLRAQWFIQKTPTHSDETLRGYFSKMKVIFYPHENDLYSEVQNWIKRDTDLRGLSFFLVDAGARKSVLLYILGSPFVSDFAVPATAIHISMDISTDSGIPFPLYQSMKDEYERRWGLLMDRVEDTGDECSLMTLADIDGSDKVEAEAV